MLLHRRGTEGPPGLQQCHPRRPGATIAAAATSPEELAQRERDGLPYAVRFELRPRARRSSRRHPRRYHRAQRPDRRRRPVSSPTACRPIIWRTSSTTTSWRSATFCAPTSGSAARRCTSISTTLSAGNTRSMPTLPLVLNPSGRGSLSKRPGLRRRRRQVLVRSRFRDAGYLPQALNNFGHNVGWSSGDDREVPYRGGYPPLPAGRYQPAPTRLPMTSLTAPTASGFRTCRPELARAVGRSLNGGYEVNAEALLAVASAAARAAETDRRRRLPEIPVGRRGRSAHCRPPDTQQTTGRRGATRLVGRPRFWPRRNRSTPKL